MLEELVEKYNLNKENYIKLEKNTKELIEIKRNIYLSRILLKQLVRSGDNKRIKETKLMLKKNQTSFKTSMNKITTTIKRQEFFQLDEYVSDMIEEYFQNLFQN